MAASCNDRKVKIHGNIRDCAKVTVFAPYLPFNKYISGLQPSSIWERKEPSRSGFSLLALLVLLLCAQALSSSDTAPTGEDVQIKTSVRKSNKKLKF